jgi:hypothetical protein
VFLHPRLYINNREHKKLGGIAMENAVKLSDWGSKGSKKVNNSAKCISIFNADIDGSRTSANVRFSVTKMSYARRLDEISHHMNYFLEVYDKENELIENLTKVRHEIHSNKDITVQEFTEYLYRTVFTPSIKMKVLSLVENNFVEVDIIKNPNNLKEIYPERKALMISAVALKLIIPAVFEFIDMNDLKAQDYLLDIYSPLFKVFEETKSVPDDLRAFVNFKVKCNHMTNSKLYQVLELSTNKVAEDLYRVLLTESLFKCTFDKDALSFIHVVLSKQLQYLMLTPVKSI